MLVDILWYCLLAYVGVTSACFTFFVATMILINQIENIPSDRWTKLKRKVTVREFIEGSATGTMMMDECGQVWQYRDYTMYEKLILLLSRAIFK